MTHVLLPVPSIDGGNITDLLTSVPKDAVILGGNLTHPTLRDRYTIDLLQDPFYVTENAAITAHCALKHLMNALPVTLANQQVLVIGWGRISKCLCRYLRNLDAQVTVCARKASDRALASALGFNATDPSELPLLLPGFRVIVNTAPAPVLSEELSANCAAGCLKLDLASAKGIDGNDVIWARGLPGKDVPESSGKLIAETVLRLITGKEHCL